MLPSNVQYPARPSATFAAAFTSDMPIDGSNIPAVIHPVNNMEHNFFLILPIVFPLISQMRMFYLPLPIPGSSGT